MTKPTHKNKRCSIYLAGGFRSGWQKIAAKRLKNCLLLDPSNHGLESTADFVDWDLAAIRKCDVVLANMESTNPGGYALALEIGYAFALGKTIVFVESHPDKVREKYFEMVRAVALFRTDNLDNALSFIEALIQDNYTYEK